MNPFKPTLYQHPWIPESYHEWQRDDNNIWVIGYWKYPEDPRYGFFVRTNTAEGGLYHVGPVKFSDDGHIALRSGSAYAFRTLDEVTEHIEKMYLKNEGMEKVHDIDDLAVAPF